MTHIKILSTTNYKLFKNLFGNRDIQPSHVRRMAKTRTEEYKTPEDQDKLDQLRQARMVIVNEKYEIIDGQHNVQEAILSKRPVYYTIIKDTDINDVKILNIDVSKWKFINHLNSFVKQKKKDYILYKEYWERYNFPLTVNIRLLIDPYSFKRNINDNYNFKKGLFVVVDYKKSQDRAVEILRILEHAHPSVKSSNRFYDAVFHMFQKHADKIDKLYEKTSGKDKIYRMNTRNEYLKQFEDLLDKGNYGTPTRLI